MIVISIVNEREQLGIFVPRRRRDAQRKAIAPCFKSIHRLLFRDREGRKVAMISLTRYYIGINYDADLQRNASLSPVPLLGCSALSGLWTRCANCGLMPCGGEMCISRSCTLTGSGGAMLFLFLPIMPKTFFFVHAVAREYLLVGEIGSFEWYGGEDDTGEVVLW